MTPHLFSSRGGVIAGPGAILFATMFVPLKGREAYMALNIPSNRENCGSVKIVSYIVKMQCL